MLSHEGDSLGSEKALGQGSPYITQAPARAGLPAIPLEVFPHQSPDPSRPAGSAPAARRQT
jgi:hypothetical protein